MRISSYTGGRAGGGHTWQGVITTDGTVLASAIGGRGILVFVLRPTESKMS